MHALESAAAPHLYSIAFCGWFCGPWVVSAVAFVLLTHLAHLPLPLACRHWGAPVAPTLAPSSHAVTIQ